MSRSNPRYPRSIALSAAGALALSLLAMPAVSAHPGDPPDPADTGEAVDLLFDVQPAGAPLAEGAIEVHPQTAYSAEQGYGFTGDLSDLGDRDRGDELDDLRRDFITSGGSFDFAVDVPDGAYTVTTWSGDHIASSRTAYTIEGVDYGDQHAGSGVINERAFDPVVVDDGQLTITIGGNSPRLNGIRVQSAVPAPTGLAVSAVDVGAPSVSLTWHEGTDVQHYRVYRSAEGEQEHLLGEVTQSTYVDTEVRLADSYTYTVVAVADDGRHSPPSQELWAQVTDPDLSPPPAPQAPELQHIDRHEVDLSWQPVDGALAYDVQRSRSADGPFDVIARVDEPGYRDTDVLTTVEYTYRVVAINAGGPSAASDALTTPAVTTLVRQAEYLDRAPVAVDTEEGIYLGWRQLGTDPDSIAFHVYRDGVRITEEALSDSTNLLDADGGSSSVYTVTAVQGETEQVVTAEFSPWDEQYLEIALDKPAGGTTPDGVDYEYVASDATVADLTGDGRYDIVMLWNPDNAKDNAHTGHTGNVYIDAYTLDGEQLWRIDLGHNIRAGAHYTQLMVYDFDGDGHGEVIVKTADGTTDAAGTVIGDPQADYRNDGGYVLDGPEFLTLFDGATGTITDTVDYVPARGNVADWGDDYGNRVDRFLAGVAYLDGESPSAVFSRGYYTRTVIAAWDVVDDALQQRWVFDSDEAGAQYEGQGNHQLSVADVDGDGLDEIVFGAMTIDADGTVLYNSDLGHGDAMHVGDFDPSREGLEVFGVLECMACSDHRAATFRDAATGEILWDIPGDRDTGRGATGDIDPRYEGAESWAIGGDAAWDSPVGHLMAADGTLIGEEIPAANFLTWWDGDLLREITDHDFDEETRTGQPWIAKWDWEAQEQVRIFEPSGVRSNNDTKGNPMLQADLFGDWREELMFRTAHSEALRIYTTTDLTEHRLRTLMHDPVYRLGVAWQNVAYNQPPHTSYYLGEGMEQPPPPSIEVVGGPDDGVRQDVPGQPVLSDDEGHDFGLSDGTYTVTANMWWGQNGTVARLFEDGVLIHAELLEDDTPAAQRFSVPVHQRPNGSYVYTAELTNAAGTTTSAEHTVTVRNAEPGAAVLAHDNWARTGEFTVTMNMWWGTNATTYRLYQDGVLIDTQDLTANTPAAQHAGTQLTGLDPGRYTYTAELENHAGITQAQQVIVDVGG